MQLRQQHIFPCNHENSRCKDDNDNNKQNKEQYPELSIAHDNNKCETVDRPHQITQISTTTNNSLQTDHSICNRNITRYLQQHIKRNDGSSDNNVNNMSSSGSIAFFFTIFFYTIKNTITHLCTRFQFDILHVYLLFITFLIFVQTQ